MAPEVAYADPGTDSHPPVFEYRGREHPSPSIVPIAEEIATLGGATVFRVWVDGTLHRMREFDRVCAWIPASQTATANSEQATAEEVSPVGLPAEVEEAITELVNLPQGWDGYGGLPVRPEVAEHARRFMAAIGECTQLVPDFVPLSDGGLQLEWFVGGYEVEVAIAPCGTTHVHFECTNDGRTKEFPLGDSLDTEEIDPLFRELRR